MRASPYSQSMSQNAKYPTVKILQHPHPVIVEAQSDNLRVRWKIQLPQGYGFEALEILDGHIRVLYSYLAGTPHSILEHLVRFDSCVDKNEATCYLAHERGGQVVTLVAPLESSVRLSKPA